MAPKLFQIEIIFHGKLNIFLSANCTPKGVGQSVSISCEDLGNFCAVLILFISYSEKKERTFESYDIYLQNNHFFMIFTIQQDILAR